MAFSQTNAATIGLLDRTVRARRKELGLDQTELANKVGVSQQTISRWERGIVAPPPKRLAQLALALDLELDRVLAYAGYLSPVTDGSHRQLLNILTDRMTELSEEELLGVMDRARKELWKLRAARRRRAGAANGTG